MVNFVLYMMGLPCSILSYGFCVKERSVFKVSSSAKQKRDMMVLEGQFTFQVFHDQLPKGLNIRKKCVCSHEILSNKFPYNNRQPIH